SIKYFAQQTGKSEEEIARDIERDFYMDAEEAKAYGIIDHIMENAKKGDK
ncbi:MAG: ATP-dependent Clp protease proteolytic subunit, partial [Treponema sp.]|nr:ATP-dependent Clp protease proteolytic subunit [Treponema sp.]